MKKLLIVLSMMTFSLVSTAQRVAVAPVLDIAVFVSETNEYVLASQGLVENPYTNVIIKKVGNIMVFKVLRSDTLPLESTYQIIKRKSGKRIILAKKLDDGSGSIIRIVQKKYTTELHCEYNDTTNRYDSVFIFGALEFNKVKAASLEYLNLN